jgi:hypothetical protein
MSVERGHVPYRGQLQRVRNSGHGRAELTGAIRNLAAFKSRAPERRPQRVL